MGKLGCPSLQQFPPATPLLCPIISLVASCTHYKLDMNENSAQQIKLRENEVKYSKINVHIRQKFKILENKLSIGKHKKIFENKSKC